MAYKQERIKPYSQQGEKKEQVEAMFDHIAPTYDFLNHTLSLGIDRGWRQKAINALKPFAPQLMLDIATGTGDFAIMAAKTLKPAKLIGADISEGMMQVGRKKVQEIGLQDCISFERQDCLHLTYPDATFDAESGVGVG
ncbi:MAG: class I SAM-dependent methyltransferase, partial [Bacteroidaceae bacterium]|nr:class I SAM-dependent methyltransferase [Bacteroidaceae bacterium]